MKKAIVIGAGFGGLGTAAFLAKEGYDVTILEKNSSIGGRAMVWKEKGFTFDMGPSWYQMPQAFERFFAHFGKQSSDYYELIKLEPQYTLFFSKREPLQIHSSMKKNLELFEELDPGVTPRIKAFLASAKEQFDLSYDNVLYRNFDSIKDFFNTDMMKAGPRFNILQNLNDAVEKVTSNPYLQKILMYTVLFLGGSPKKTPGMFSLMTHLDLGLGTYYPMGGIGKVIEGIASLCKELGVTIITDAEVTKLAVTDGKVTEVITTNGSYTADVIVSNADYPFTEMHLLDPEYQTYPESYWKKKVMAPSAFIMYLGITGKVKSFSHHSLFLEDDWQEFFDDLFKGEKWSHQPSFYVSCTSKTDHSVAPEGHENLFITVQIPANAKDTPQLRKEYADHILSSIEKKSGESIRDRIVVQRIFAGNDFAKTFNAYKNTAIGLANTLFQSAYFRPLNKSKKVANLYYAGQYAHPGVGMPMCLISAELTAKRILNDS